jgi:hypothetical protein
MSMFVKCRQLEDMSGGYESVDVVKSITGLLRFLR